MNATDLALVTSGYIVTKCLNPVGPTQPLAEHPVDLIIKQTAT